MCCFCADCGKMYIRERCLGVECCAVFVQTAVKSVVYWTEEADSV